MSEVKKIATRDSYGNALVEVGKDYDNLVVLDADLAAALQCLQQEERLSRFVILSDIRS